MPSHLNLHRFLGPSTPHVIAEMAKNRVNELCLKQMLTACSGNESILRMLNYNTSRRQYKKNQQMIKPRKGVSGKGRTQTCLTIYQVDTQNFVLARWIDWVLPHATS